MSDELLSPEEFADTMKKLAESLSGDKEEMHCAMDGLLCGQLSALGFGDGVDIFETTDKWHA